MICQNKPIQVDDNDYLILYECKSYIALIFLESLSFRDVICIEFKYSTGLIQL